MVTLSITSFAAVVSIAVVFMAWGVYKYLQHSCTQSVKVPVLHQSRSWSSKLPLTPCKSFTSYPTQFQQLDAYTRKPITTEHYFSALLPHNRAKNRYSDVLALEATRVKIGVNGDYINANFVKGYLRGIPNDRAYIAAQGPTVASVEDFWQMLWEQNTTVIVNLTKERENGRVKCEKYWPDANESKTIKLWRITHVGLLENGEWLSREFEVVHTETNERRIVYQLHFVAWPDHGVPESTTGFLQLIKEAHSLHTGDSPIIVHCSAGIGRTGTFITIANVIHQMKLEGGVVPDLCAVIAELRQQRHGIVQTVEQFQYCPKAIEHYIRSLQDSHQ